MNKNRWIGILLALTAGICLPACSLHKSIGRVNSAAPESSFSIESSTEGLARVEKKEQSQKEAEEPSEWKQVEIAQVSYSPYYPFQQQRSCYQELTEEEQEVYRALLEAASLLSAVPDENGQYYTRPVQANLPEARMGRVVSALRDDNPQLFWLTNSYSFVRYSGAQEEERTEMSLYSFLSAEEGSTASQKLGQAVQSFVNSLSEGMSQYERERLIHDYIASRCSYHQEAFENMGQWQDYWEAFSSYGAMVSGSAVCEGYARAFELLASYAGLESALISGESQNQGHMWNVVKLGSEWYHLDLTWDDTATGDQHRPYYFNLTEEQISYDHTIYQAAEEIPAEQWEGDGNAAPQNYNLFVPECTSTAENFFQKEGFTLSTLDAGEDQRAITALEQAVQKKSGAFYLSVDSRMDYRDTIEKLFQKEPYKFAYYIEQANQRLADNQQIALDQVTYVEMEGQRAVVIQLPNQTKGES